MRNHPIDLGSLFTFGFLVLSIQDEVEWTSLSDEVLDAFEASLCSIVDRFPLSKAPNESQTEDDLIWPVLKALGWTDSLRRQNLSRTGREHEPDGILFKDSKTKDKANQFQEEWRRFALAQAIVESKRWAAPLDRGAEDERGKTAPSTQIARYLRQADSLTEGKLRWGILTNGAKWRLHFSGARFGSKQFFELDLAAILNLPDYYDRLPTGQAEEGEANRRHWLKVFYLLFRRDAFVPSGVDPRSFHEKVIEKGRLYEERLAEDLSTKVFDEVFPDLAKAILQAALKANLQADLPVIREAALVLLYRLLFTLYAEDRDLLPVNDTRYDDYAVRKIRLDVQDRKDKMMSSPRQRRAIGMRYPIYSRSLIKATAPSACRLIMVVCSIRKAIRC